MKTQLEIEIDEMLSAKVGDMVTITEIHHTSAWSSNDDLIGMKVKVVDPIMLATFANLAEDGWMFGVFDLFTKNEYVDVPMYICGIKFKIEKQDENKS